MKKIKHLANTLIFGFTTIVSSTMAQNEINFLRYDDDFSLVKNDSLKKGPDYLKYNSFGNHNYISFGGELREQFQIYRNLNFGDVPPSYQNTSPTQLWHRFLLHTNIEVGNHLRLFIQFNNTLRFLNDNPITSEIDENQLSLHQAFAEVNLHQWKFRLGRQELLYGNSRLITVREGPNTRLTFDGVVIKRTTNKGRIDFLTVSKVISKQNIFDDESFKECLIGIYGTRYFANHKIGLDYFALNFQSKASTYNYRTGFENRQTYGTRLFVNTTKVNFELEGAYQSGTFDNLTIDAYNILVDVNVQVLPSKKGVIGLAANAASGDNDSEDRKLNTYNLLYAKPAYGLAIPIGATNMISIYPYVKINPIQKLNIVAQVFFLARNSNQDGTYSPGMVENRPSPNLLFTSRKKTLGVFYTVETTYRQNKNLSFSFDASYFSAGSYPLATGLGKDIVYISFKSTFKF